ncbi:Orphan Neuropeptide Receptor 2 [Frankliniella occidentalis]|uniref:Mu-type opioid receptor-like n=1 Tax=Frankliniella occidentalis TaxID=133901 RepID=A0A6J1T839_FRAOC|nr:mu-type opioid receptor-like [Frankliniella occidentalis]KAE8745415.1 Orphan Neuropeptide Receptor 2 [Frankliniella occidentalis]
MAVQLQRYPDPYYYPSVLPGERPPPAPGLIAEHAHYYTHPYHPYNPANSSYWFGNDTTGGWGPRFFYTFYTEGGDRRPWDILEASVFAVVFLVSVLANVSIAAAVLRYREMRTVTNCFLLNLAAADLVFALGSPLVAAARVTDEWPLGSTACRLLPYSQFVCGFVLLWTLTLISMDRYRCIVVPPYRSTLTPTLALALTAATWLLAAVVFLPVAFWFHVQRTEGGDVCTLVFPHSDSVNLSLCFTVPVLLLACLLPMALFVFHYQRIFRKLVETRSRWAAPCVVVAAPSSERSESAGSDTPGRRGSELSFVGSLMAHAHAAGRKVSAASQLGSMGGMGRSGSLSHHEELRLNKHIRVVRVLLLNVLVVLVMWLPITVIMSLIYVDGSRPTEDTDFFLRSHHFIWALLAALLNTVVNPLLYGLFSENFRACFARLWFASRRRAMAAGQVAARQTTPASKASQPEAGVGADYKQTSRTPSGGTATNGGGSGGRSVY